MNAFDPRDCFAKDGVVHQHFFGTRVQEAQMLFDGFAQAVAQ